MRGLMVTSGHSKYLKMIKEKLECDFDLNQTDNQKFDLTLHTKHKKQHAAVENLLYFLRKMKDHDIMGLTEAQLLWFLQESNYVAKTIVDIPLLPWNLIRNHQTLSKDENRRILESREDYWMLKLRTLTPDGLNDHLNSTTKAQIHAICA